MKYSKIKKLKSFFIFIVFLCSCKTIDLNTNINPENPEFKLVDISYNVDSDKSIITKEGFFKSLYEFNISFKNKNNDFTVSCEITDFDGNSLLKFTNEKTFINENGNYIIKKNFRSLFLFNKIKYNINVGINNEIKNFSGEYINNNLPDLQLFEKGPIITSFLSKKNNININIKLSIANCNNIKWIHLIPPSMDSYWQIPFKIENNIVDAGALISEKDKAYINNGSYILQINFDKLGIIQKNIDIIDIYNNAKGKNYGFPLNTFVTDEDEKILINPEFLDKIDYLEIWFFMNIGGNYQKIGINKILRPEFTINKKDLKNNIIDDMNKKIKLKDNTEYFYRIYVYSVKYNDIYYLSISELKSIVFKKFKYMIF